MGHNLMFIPFDIKTDCVKTENMTSVEAASPLFLPALNQSLEVEPDVKGNQRKVKWVWIKCSAFPQWIVQVQFSTSMCTRS